MNTIFKAMLLGAAFCAPGAGFAQDYPTKAVTMVVPFGPGGSNDTIGRFLAEALGKHWNQTVLVENRAGAGTAIGAAHVAQSAPDGHTMLFVSTSMTTNVATQTQLPYDPKTDLQPVAMAARGDLFVIAGSRVPLATLADVQREAQAQTLFTGTPGIGAIGHLGAIWLNKALGIETEFVHYKSGAEVMTDLGGGRVDLFLGILFEATGGLGKPIAVMSEERASGLPDVPTVAEAGFPDATAGLWWGVFVPSGTPAEVVAKLNQDIVTVMQGPGAVEFLEKQGLTASDMGVEEFTDHVWSAIDQWTGIAEENGLRN